MPSSSSNSVIEGSQVYAYPSNVNAASFVSIKLAGESNYKPWQAQMWCLMDSHDMLGFINGTLTKPHKNNGSKSKEDMTLFEARYREWKRSDTLVKGWIFGSLSEDVMGAVFHLQTANDVWKELNKKYTKSIIEGNSSLIAREKEVGDYLPLYRAIKMGDWEKAEEFLNQDGDALTKKINIDGYRALHFAVGNHGNTLFLENLLERINPDLLPTLVNDLKQNALHFAAILGNTDAVKKLVEKNPHMLFTSDYEDALPIDRAICNFQTTTFLYLFQGCKQHIELSQKEGYHNPLVGKRGFLLLTSTLSAGLFDFSYEFLKENPKLALERVVNHRPLLWYIARAWDAYPSGQRYNFYQRFIYSHMATKDYFVGDTYKIPDIERQGEYSVNPLTSMKNYVYLVIRRIYVKFWEVALLHVPHIKQLHNDKLKHNYALNILKLVCEEVGKLKYGHMENYHGAFIRAVYNDTPEVVQQIIRTFPHSIWVFDDMGYRVSQICILNRCENIYNLIVHEVAHDKHFHKLTMDENENNLLHLAGRLAPAVKLNMVTGSALQMQRELQWFQEVSKLVLPKDIEHKNNKQDTPIMVFNREHQDLRQKGEEWMKKTADSCTITAALIITIVFAAAITVPGGNNDDTGKAIYETRPSFVIFVVSDAISLFTATTSLLLFLSILTARYAEEDFLYKLPKRMIIGLMMLFMSVTTMLIAFSATLYITFGQGKSWILIPIAALTCLPIASFVTLQLPLLVDLVSSTYGHGIFGKRRGLWTTS